MLERLLEIGDYDAAALLLLALRETDARARSATAAPWAYHAASRVFLEYAALLTRLQLPDLARHYCALAASDDAAAAPRGKAPPAAMDAAEAAQLVQQLARLQEEAALRR